MNESRSLLVAADNYIGAFERLTRFLAWLYIPLVGVFIYEVISRYLFATSHDWFLEIAVNLSVLCGFVGAGSVTFQRRHIALDVIYERCPMRAKRWLDMFNSAAGAVISGVLLFFVIERAVFLNDIDAHFSSSISLPKS